MEIHTLITKSSTRGTLNIPDPKILIQFNCSNSTFNFVTNLNETVFINTPKSFVGAFLDDTFLSFFPPAPPWRKSCVRACWCLRRQAYEETCKNQSIWHFSLLWRISCVRACWWLRITDIWRNMIEIKQRPERALILHQIVGLTPRGTRMIITSIEIVYKIYQFLKININK